MLHYGGISTWLIPVIELCSIAAAAIIGIALWGSDE